MQSLIFLGVIALIIFSSLITVNQGTIAVITMFGKYRRILMPGLRFKIPFIENIYKRISIQNQESQKNSKKGFLIVF